MLFVEHEGQPVPLLSIRTAEGTAIVPDGVQTFNLQQAARRWPDRSEQSLRGMWLATCRPLAGEHDEAKVAELPPELAAPPDLSTPAGRTARAKLDVLKIVKFPYLSDEEFEYFIEVCRLRAFDPWTGQIVPVIREENGKREVELITTLAAFRRVGQRSGCHSEVGPEWCGKDGVWVSPWTKDENPFAARAGVTKPGETQTTWQIAYWDMCVQYATDARGNVIWDEKTGFAVPGEFWNTPAKGAHMLGKCGFAAVYRAACNEDLGRLYTFDEGRNPRAPRPAGPAVGPRQAPAAAEAGDDAGLEEDALVDECTPTTEPSFHRELLNLNFNTRESRSMLVRQFEAKFPGMRGTNPPRFYALVLHTVRPNPQRYGAEPDDVLEQAAGH